MDSMFGPPESNSDEIRAQWADALGRYVAESLLVSDGNDSFAPRLRARKNQHRRASDLGVNWPRRSGPGRGPLSSIMT